MESRVYKIMQGLIDGKYKLTAHAERTVIYVNYVYIYNIISYLVRQSDVTWHVHVS